MTQAPETKSPNPSDTPAWKRRAKSLARTVLLGGGGMKKMAVYFAAWLTVWPLVGAAIFPRAEQVLKEQGLDPKIASELAPGKRIYVRTDNLLGKAHALLDLGPWGIPVVWYKAIRRGSEGGHANSGALGLNTFGLCEIYLHASEYKSPAPEDFQYPLLHEIRHCSNDNVRLLTAHLRSTVVAEGDADYHAIDTLARERKQPELRQKFMNQIAMRKSTTDALHDDALYVDAMFNSKAPPARAEIAAANVAASVTYKNIRDRELLFRVQDMTKGTNLPDICKQGEEEKAICAYDPASENLSPLALRRAQLYTDAMRGVVAATEVRFEVQEPARPGKIPKPS
ncbi:MAG: hypothetical protein ACAH83_01855 [Alphaproteobacteria bacterium]